MQWTFMERDWLLFAEIIHWLSFQWNILLTRITSLIISEKHGKKGGTQSTRMKTHTTSSKNPCVSGLWMMFRCSLISHWWRITRWPLIGGCNVKHIPLSEFSDQMVNSLKYKRGEFSSIPAFDPRLNMTHTQRNYNWVYPQHTRGELIVHKRRAVPVIPEKRHEYTVGSLNQNEDQHSPHRRTFIQV